MYSRQFSRNGVFFSSRSMIHPINATTDNHIHLQVAPPPCLVCSLPHSPFIVSWIFHFSLIPRIPPRKINSEEKDWGRLVLQCNFISERLRYGLLFSCCELVRPGAQGYIFGRLMSGKASLLAVT